MEDLLNKLLNFTASRPAIDRSRMYILDLLNIMDLTKNILLTWETELMINKMYGDVYSKINLFNALLGNLGKSYSRSIGNSVDSNTDSKAVAMDQVYSLGNYDKNYRSSINEKNYTIAEESFNNRNYCLNDSGKYLEEKESNPILYDCMNVLKICPTQFPKKNIGKYSHFDRLRKILSYKIKQLKKRIIKPVSRIFTGRSSVAKTKLRLRGRFVKKNTVIKKNIFKVIHNKLNRKNGVLNKNIINEGHKKN